MKSLLVGRPRRDGVRGSQSLFLSIANAFNVLFWCCCCETFRRWYEVGRWDRIPRIVRRGSVDHRNFLKVIFGRFLKLFISKREHNQTFSSSFSTSLLQTKNEVILPISSCEWSCSEARRKPTNFYFPLATIMSIIKFPVHVMNQISSMSKFAPSSSHRKSKSRVWLKLIDCL